LDYTPSDVGQILAATAPQTPQRAVFSPFVPGPAAAATPEPEAAGTPGPEPVATPGPEPAAEPYKPGTTSREKRSVPVSERLANYSDLLDGAPQIINAVRMNFQGTIWGESLKSAAVARKRIRTKFEVVKQISAFIQSKGLSEEMSVPVLADLVGVQPEFIIRYVLE
jgi:hypothetical protein